MSGSKSGAAKAVQTKLKKYGPNFMKEVGRAGGNARNKSKKKYIPFREDKSLASLAGKIGSSRRWVKERAKQRAASEEAKEESKQGVTIDTETQE